jgi:CRISPR-associated DxTHG motif protein
MIISILGTAGAKLDKKHCIPIPHSMTLAFYNAMQLNKPSTLCKNSTHFLLKNYDDRFIFLGTDCAISFQKKLLKEDLQDKNVTFIKISDNDLDDIFEKIFTLLDEQEEVLLDITHGFRHQPIMAIFAATLSQFLERKNLKIIFAKEEIQYEKYSYTYLNTYIETTRISLLLTGFIRTLNFIPVKESQLINSHIFENFSKSLLANDLKGVITHVEKLFSEINRLLQKKELQHIADLLRTIKNEELKDLHHFKSKSDHEKYLILSQLTKEKNYLIVSLTYLFESLREYVSDRFSPLTKDLKLKKGYETNTAVMDTVGNYKRNGKTNKIQQKYPKLHILNQNQFRRIDTIYKNIRTLRNDLAHINKTKNFSDIKQDLSNMIFQVETIYKDNLLQHIKTD